MQEIEIGATIGAIYNFVFGNFWRLIGIVWLAVAVRSAVSLYFIVPLAQKIVLAAAAHDVGTMGMLYVQLLPAYAVVTLLLLMTGVGVTRLALDHSQPIPFVFVSLGRDFWWFVLSTLVLTLLLLALVVFLVVLGGAVGGVMGALGGGIASVRLVAQIMTIIVLYGGTFLVVVRLGLVLPSIIISERGVGLGLARSWRLTGGQFWRVLAILLAVVLPVVAISVLQTVFFGVLIGTDFTKAMSSPANTLAWMQGISTQMRAYPYIYFPIQIATSALGLGLVFGAGAAVYRALVPTSGTRVADVF